MHSVFMIIHPVRASDLPEPLRKHLQWVYDEITWRPARHKLEGTVEATLAQMKNSTASKIAERVLALADALDELHHHCQGVGRGSIAV
jgi:hypothetical protein